MNKTSEEILQNPPHQVRRTDRMMADEAEIRALLHRAAYGALATSNQGQPFINTNLFVYDETAHVIYLHTAQVGRTRTNIEQNPRVCFSVSEMGRLLPAEEALEFSVEYAGVAVFGKASILTDAGEKRHGLQLLLDKYFPHLRPGEHYHSITGEELQRTSVYRIGIEQWSGKVKTVGADFPGAFWYAESSKKDRKA